MPIDLSKVVWAASNIPAGLSFNTKTGTFTGKPTEAGVYTVPVSVDNGYGTDEKDVSIIIEENAFPVYAVGSHAAMWSNNAEADENGFRKLSMPEVVKLTRLYNGFSAKTADGSWYVCGDGYYVPNAPNLSDFDNHSSSDGFANYSIPTKYKVNDVLEMAGSSFSTHYYFKCRTSTNQVLTAVYDMQNATGRSAGVISGIKKLQKDYSSAYEMPHLLESNLLISSTSSISIDISSYGMKTFLGGTINIGSVGRSIIAFLTFDGKFYEVNRAGTKEITRIGTDLGAIKDFWGYSGVSSSLGGDWGNLFVLTENNILYAKGPNGTNHVLGLPNSETYKELTEVGIFDVKRITYGSGATFLLSNNGELYHAGAKITGITDAHTDGFTRIYPDYNFQDIIYTAGTLVARIKED